MKEIDPRVRKINVLAPKLGSKEISPNQRTLNLDIEKDADVGGIGMGVLSDGTPYLNQRGLAALCGVENAHIGTISSQWNDLSQKPRIVSIKAILEKISLSYPSAHVDIIHNGRTHFCYPADVCLAILEYYAFDAGANCQPQSRDNFRILAGSKLRELIYSHVGYDPTRKYAQRFDKWHERIAINFQSAPRGFFHVFNETHTVIYELIQAGADIDEHFVVDIRAGRAVAGMAASVAGRRGTGGCRKDNGSNMSDQLGDAPIESRSEPSMYEPGHPLIGVDISERDEEQ